MTAKSHPGTLTATSEDSFFGNRRILSTQSEDGRFNLDFIRNTPSDGSPVIKTLDFNYVDADGQNRRVVVSDLNGKGKITVQAGSLFSRNESTFRDVSLYNDIVTAWSQAQTDGRIDAQEMRTLRSLVTQAGERIEAPTQGSNGMRYVRSPQAER